MMVDRSYGDWLIVIGEGVTIVLLSVIEVLTDLTPANHHVEGCDEITIDKDPNPINEVMILLQMDRRAQRCKDLNPRPIPKSNYQ